MKMSLLLLLLAAQEFPPSLPGGKGIVTESSPDLLKPPTTLRPGVEIARTPPTVDFMYFPGQDYPGNPWSCWGDGVFANGKYYTAIGDHLAIGRKGSNPERTGAGFIYEYDPGTKTLRMILDVKKLLALPPGHYTPGKVHSRLDVGADGWVYFGTHRGSPSATTDEFHYKGDWIIRTHPGTGKSEVLAHGPVPKHAIPTSVLDPQRLIFYGGTAPGMGDENSGTHFFAFDVKSRKVLFVDPDGPARYMIFAKSTGRVYYLGGKDHYGPLKRFDPATGKSEQLSVELGLRAATQETPQGVVYTVSQGRKGADAELWAFHTKTETAEKLGGAEVGSQGYLATLDADPTGRYLYYTAGAHGGSEQDGTPLVQFDVKTRKKKVIAFLHPFFKDKYGCALKGTYSMAVDDTGGTVYVTWNNSRGSKVWDTCVLTAIHIPASERQP